MVMSNRKAVGLVVGPPVILPLAGPAVVQETEVEPDHPQRTGSPSPSATMEECLEQIARLESDLRTATAAPPAA